MPLSLQVTGRIILTTKTIETLQICCEYRLPFIEIIMLAHSLL